MWGLVYAWGNAILSTVLMIAGLVLVILLIRLVLIVTKKIKNS